MAAKKKTPAGKGQTVSKSNTRSQTKRKSASKPRVTKAELERLQKQEHRKRQIWAVILFAVGVLLGAIIFVKGQNVWLWLHNVLLGIFGMGVFAVPILLIYIAIRATIDEKMGKIKHKLWQSLVLMALLCGLIQIVLVGSFSGVDWKDIIRNLYFDGTSYLSGGVLSIVIGLPLMAACGKTGATIIIVLFFFAFILLITGATLLDAFRTVSKPVKKMEDHYVQKREQREQERQEKFNIDVDLGPDALPQHPVSSSKAIFDLAPKPDLSSEAETREKTDRFIDIVRQTSTSKHDIAKEDLIAGQTDLPAGDEPKETTELDDLVQKAIPEEKTPPLKKEEQLANQKEIAQQMQYSQQQILYQYPPVSLLKAPVNRKSGDVSGELKANAERLVDTLKSFGVQTRVVDISRGPTVTRYELQPSAGVKISKITGLADDIALNLAAAGVRIEAPIPNKAAVGIEVPNKVTDIVAIREIIDSKAFRDAKSKLSVALGRDISGKEIVFDIAKMPHMLIAGATGSGKSVCINTLIISLLYKASPEEVRLLMIDPKVVELGVYNGIPHLLVPVVTDPRKAAGALGWAVTEMLNRYKLFAEHQVRDLNGYNELARTVEEINPLPQIVIIIDELADLMMAAPNEVEDSICRLAQMARAAGMHLVIATQRPSVDVITGVIKANIPSRIAFSVSSQVDSRTIIDSAGAEKLLGRGDMLFSPVGALKPTRLQCCFVSDKEVEDVVKFVKGDSISEYDDKIMDEIEKQAVKEKTSGKSSADGGGFDDEDELLPQAIECVIEASQASTSYLQRKLKVGYARAARLMDDMEEKGIIGPFEGSKPRQVLMTREQWIEMKMNRLDGEAE
jgi:S-DNA-T family DNA segregation ATPase FtsK/SpoIIIE